MAVVRNRIVLDTFATGEWFFDEPQQQLYIWLNDSSASPPAPGDVVATSLIAIINATGTSIEPPTSKLNPLFLLIPHTSTLSWNLAAYFAEFLDC